MPKGKRRTRPIHTRRYDAQRQLRLAAVENARGGAWEFCALGELVPGGGSVEAVAPFFSQLLAVMPSGIYAQPMGDDVSTIDTFFQGSPEGLEICRVVREAISALGEASMTVTKSQIAFRHRRAFAYIWRPGQYVKSDVPAVLSIALPCAVASDRFKEVAHPAPKVWMHHIELRKPSDVDDQVLEWLTEAYASAR